MAVGPRPGLAGLRRSSTSGTTALVKQRGALDSFLMLPRISFALRGRSRAAACGGPLAVVIGDGACAALPTSVGSMATRVASSPEDPGFFVSWRDWTRAACRSQSGTTRRATARKASLVVALCGLGGDEDRTHQDGSQVRRGRQRAGIWNVEVSHATKVGKGTDSAARHPRGVEHVQRSAAYVGARAPSSGCAPARRTATRQRQAWICLAVRPDRAAGWLARGRATARSGITTGSREVPRGFSQGVRY